MKHCSTFVQFGPFWKVFQVSCPLLNKEIYWKKGSRDLNISKDNIISIFILEGILPKNFLSLQENPNQLPRLKNECKIERVWWLSKDDCYMEEPWGI